MNIAFQWSVETDLEWIGESGGVPRGVDEVNENTAVDRDGDDFWAILDCGGALGTCGFVVAVDAYGCAEAGAFHEAIACGSMRGEKEEER